MKTAFSDMSAALAVAAHLVDGPSGPRPDVTLQARLKACASADCHHPPKAAPVPEAVRVRILQHRQAGRTLKEIARLTGESYMRVWRTCREESR